MRRFLLLSLLVLSLIFVGCNGDINNGGSGNNGGDTTTPQTPETEAKPNINNEVAYLDFKSLDPEILDSEFPDFVNSAYFIARIVDYLYDLVPSDYLQTEEYYTFTEEAVRAGTLTLNDNIGQVVVSSVKTADFNINLAAPKTVIVEDTRNGYKDTLLFDGKLTLSRQSSQMIMTMDNFHFEMSRIHDGVDIGTAIKVEKVSGAINVAEYNIDNFIYNFNVGNVVFNTNKYNNYNYIFELIYKLINNSVSDSDFTDGLFNLEYPGYNATSYSGTYTFNEGIYSLSGVYTDESNNLSITINMDMKLLPNSDSGTGPSYYKISIIKMDIDGLDIGQNVITGAIETI